MNRPQVLTWKALMTSATPAMIIMTPTTTTLATVALRMLPDAAERDDSGDEIDDAEGDDPTPFGVQRRERLSAPETRECRHVDDPP